MKMDNKANRKYAILPLSIPWHGVTMGSRSLPDWETEQLESLKSTIAS